MLAYPQPYVGYADDSSHSTWNISSTALAIYSSNGKLVYLWGICIDLSSNNIIEYSAMINLLSDAISHGI